MKIEERPRAWGDWRFEGKKLFYRGMWSERNLEIEYWCDLWRIRSCAEMLDFIFQVRDKPWADEKCIKGLLDAFFDIFNPQENYCSWGKEAESVDPLRLILWYEEISNDLR